MSFRQTQLPTRQLTGITWEIDSTSEFYPEPFRNLDDPPSKLFGIGNIESMQEGLAIIGARKATPYGTSCAKHFGRLAAMSNVVVISGGALGCDAASQLACLEAGGKTISFIGSGYKNYYPRRHFDLFQKIIDSGGAVVSENPPEFQALPYTHRARNRLIASLAKATLIVEAGVPSGTFSTADSALQANREVLVIPGAITSELSKGCNRLIYQGATPIIDDESFFDQMVGLFGSLKQKELSDEIMVKVEVGEKDEHLLRAITAQKMSLDELLKIANSLVGESEALGWLMVWLTDMVSKGVVAQYPDGRYGPAVR